MAVGSLDRRLPILRRHQAKTRVMSALLTPFKLLRVREKRWVAHPSVFLWLPSEIPRIPLPEHLAAFVKLVWYLVQLLRISSEY